MAYLEQTCGTKGYNALGCGGSCKHLNTTRGLQKGWSISNQGTRALGVAKMYDDSFRLSYKITGPDEFAHFGVTI